MRVFLAMVVLMSNIASPGQGGVADASPALNTNSLELIQSAPAETDLAHPGLRHAKDAWITMIDRAARSIDLAQFYASSEPGEALEPVLEALERAAERGVRLRFMISNSLLKEYPETFERIQRIKGAEARVYDISKITGSILHAKYWIIDGREVFIGSQNFDWRALTEIHELGLRIPSETLARRFEALFEIDWKIARTGKAPKWRPKLKGPRVVDGVELVASPPKLNPRGMRSAEEALLELISSAHDSIEIQLLHYSPVEGESHWPLIDNALRAAAHRGVKIRMLLSNWNLPAPKGHHTQSLASLPGVDIRIAEIPVSTSKGFVPFSRVIHGKYMIVDKKTLWMGTSNWTEDYFRYSRNLEVVVHRPYLAATTLEVFTRLWKSAYVKDALTYSIEDWAEFNPGKP